MYTQMDNDVLSCPPLVDGVTCVHVESVRDPTNSCHVGFLSQSNIKPKCYGLHLCKQ